jgi:signal transduction histidine kinase/ActR/RegA family two-component response regulator
MLPVDSVFTGKDGRRFPVRFSCEPIRKERNVIGAVVRFVDISKQKEMEFMLIQSQKMEAIGRLTGGVSHDFNNLLTVIMGNLQFVQRKIGDDEQIKTLQNKIMNAAKNGAELNNRLLSFSREQALETSPTHIREMLLEMAEFLDRILGEEINLDLQLMDEDCVVMTDRTQLENAILNLCVNAKDAMPQGGMLTISAKTRRLPESFMGHTLELTERDYIELQITDTGTGIPESIQRQIFEPFFTTKEKNRGTGLGLSTVYGFLRQSGGNITVKSLMGEGTTFNLYLPISTEGASTSTLINELVESEVNYTGTILVVEDDENVRDVAVNMLTEAGYVVITATDGPAGLEKFRENPEIDLVFSDVIMPGGMTGIEMAEQILQLRPELPILLTTGYTEKSLKDRILESSNIVCVPKPYDTNELPKYVNSMMHRFNHKAESASSD